MAASTPTSKRPASGEPQKSGNTISVMDYNTAHFTEKQAASIADCVVYKDTPTVTWINIDNVPPARFLGELGLGFDLHPVILEDIIHVDQRPKVEFMDDYVYVVVRMLYLDAKRRHVVSEQVSLVIASKFLISFQQGIQGDVFERVRNSIRKTGGRTRSSGTDYLAHKLIAAMVDSYFDILETYGERIENLEEELIQDPRTKTLQQLYGLKRELMELRKSVWPLREVVGALARAETHLVKRGTKIYLRDVYEQTVQLIDTAESYRETLASMLDVYLSSVSHKLNAVMKMLTIITTIFMPLSFLAGLYGMNFRYLPGAESAWGFPVMILGMLALSGVMLSYFKQREWL